MPDPTIEAGSQEEQNYFSWWIIMILFLIPVGGMLVVWWNNRAHTEWLMYAGGTLLAGLVVGAMANSGNDTDTAGSEQK
jgi:hypothetical protein